MLGPKKLDLPIRRHSLGAFGQKTPPPLRCQVVFQLAASQQPHSRSFGNVALRFSTSRSFASRLCSIMPMPIAVFGSPALLGWYDAMGSQIKELHKLGEAKGSLTSRSEQVYLNNLRTFSTHGFHQTSQQ
eukprot:s4692_g10.t1